MKTTKKLMLMLLLTASMLTFTSCNKDWGYAFSPEDNELVRNETHYTMKCRFAPPFHDDYSIEAFSEETFIGASLGTFKFYHIPYEMLGQTIDLTKKTDYPLSFSVGYQDFSWHSSPDDIGGAIHDEMTFDGESPFKSGTMLLEETENCITFTLKGKLKDGSTIRMKLVASAEK